MGAARVNWVAPAATGSGAQPRSGDGFAGGEPGGGSAGSVSAAALGVGAHEGAPTSVARVAGPASLFGSAPISGGELEVSGVWARGPTVGGARLAVGRAASGLSGSAVGWNAGLRASGLEHGVNGVRFLVFPWVKVRPLASVRLSDVYVMEPRMRQFLHGDEHQPLLSCAFLLAQRLFAVLRCCSRCSDDESSSHFLISRLDDTALALAVYASCRPLGRLRKTRFRGWPAFPGWDSNVPTEFR